MKILPIALLSLLLLPAVQLYSQLNYKKGYLITLTGDTLKGYINDGGEFRNARLCLFKSTKQSGPIKYTPDDINSYRFDGDKYFRSIDCLVKDTIRKVFSEVLIAGNMQLLFNTKNRELQYYLETAPGQMVGLINRKLVVLASGSNLYATDKPGNYADRFNSTVYIDLYKDTLFSIFSNCKEVQNQIVNVKYTSSSLSAITKAYLTKTCSNGNCITYEKDRTLAHIALGFYSGVQVHKINEWKSDGDNGIRQSSGPSEIFISVPFDFFINFPIKQLSEKLSAQLELKTYKVNYNPFLMHLPSPDSIFIAHMETNVFSIPFSIRYRFLNSNFSPSIGVGKETALVYHSKVVLGNNQQLSIHPNQKGGWFLDLGAEYKISNNFSTFAFFRLQNYKNLIYNSASNYSRLHYNELMDNHPYDLIQVTNFSLNIGFRF